MKTSALRPVAAFLGLLPLTLTLSALRLDPAAGAGVDGPKALFNGRNLDDWRPPSGAWQAAKSVALDPADDKKFSIQSGEGVLVNGPNGKTGNLVTREEYGDCDAHIEFVVPRNSNSGVYFMGRYEIQIFDSHGVAKPKSSDCGGVYASCSEPKPDTAGRPPGVNSSRPPGEWQVFDVVFRAPRFDATGKKTANAMFVKVVHNGRVIHENVEAPRPTCAALALDEKARGPLMLQGDHGPVAFRNLRIRP